MKQVTLKGIRVNVVPDSDGVSCKGCYFSDGLGRRCDIDVTAELEQGLDCCRTDTHYEEVKE